MTSVQPKVPFYINDDDGTVFHVTDEIFAQILVLAVVPAEERLVVHGALARVVVSYRGYFIIDVFCEGEPEPRKVYVAGGDIVSHTYMLVLRLAGIEPG